MTRSPRRSFFFVVPDAAAEWVGAALRDLFPDGVLHHPSSGGVTRLQGWLAAGRRGLSAADRCLLEGLGVRNLRQARSEVGPSAEPFGRFPPIRLGPFRILAAGDPAASGPRGRHDIVLTQGQAFGSGRHESTRLMLGALLKRPLAGSVLDVGAGSGVLGFACLALGAQRVIAVELERAACSELRVNRGLNVVSPGRLPVVLGRFPLRRLKGRRFPLVLANLVTPVLVGLMPDLVRVVEAGGALLCSGVHTHFEAVRVVRAARKAGLLPQERVALRGWYLLRFARV